ncbi:MULTISPECIES: SPOR domain-containing protein [Halomonas]|nr:SPOR domain-containing protein [Halomonas ventosae]
MRERLSGAVILIALAVIFVPMLFDDPAPRSERPQPVMTIEQPVEVKHRDVPDPQPPASLGQIQLPSASTASRQAPADRPSNTGQATDTTAKASSGANQASADAGAQDAQGQDKDPIAALARAAEQRMSQQAEQADRASAAKGGWAVQVGSFGEKANAERLASRLSGQGLPVYRRVRESGLTSVYVGPYETSREAEEVMSALKADSNLQGLLVRADN